MTGRWIMILALVLLGLQACGDGASPEDRLRAAINEMETAAEEGRRGDFMDRVAADFSGQGGRLGQQDLADLLRVQILRHSRVHAVISGIDIELIGDRATASINALLTGGPSAWLPESGRLFRIRTGWKLDDREDWILISADWEPVL